VCFLSVVSQVDLLTADKLGTVCVESAVSRLGSSRQTGLYVVSLMFGSRQRERRHQETDMRDARAPKFMRIGGVFLESQNIRMLD
jgi:hypothetical protein